MHSSSRLAHLKLKKKWPIFSSSPFAIRFNIFRPQPSLFFSVRDKHRDIYGLKAVFEVFT